MKALFLYNPESGRGNFQKYFPKIQNELASSFEEMLFLTLENKEKARDVYQNIVPKYDALILIGGDGSLHFAINELMKLDKKPILGYINSGTLGDGGKIFGVTRSLKRSISILKKQKIRQIDLGKANDTYFLYCLANGCYSSLSYTVQNKKKRHLYQFSYYFASLKEMFQKVSYTYSFQIEEKTYTKTSPFVLFLNGEYMGGFRLNKKSKDDDGLLEGYFPKPSLFNGILRFLPKKRETPVSIKEITITPSNEIPWCLDGEKGDVGEVKISVISHAISIFYR